MFSRLALAPITVFGNYNRRGQTSSSNNCKLLLKNHNSPELHFGRQIDLGPKINIGQHGLYTCTGAVSSGSGKPQSKVYSTLQKHNLVTFL